MMGHNNQGAPYGYYDAHAHAVGSSGGYVQTSDVSGGTGKAPMDFLNRLGKQAETMAGSLWGHLKVSNSVPDTALGRLSHGTRLLREGGFEGVYRQTFGFAPDEHLRKTYACYLSTSNGAVGGTLYITNQKFAFCSDRPLSYSPTPGQQASSYYKVIVPLEKVREVAPAVNVKKPTEKYIQVVTVDAHEFWYMGFVNYDKGMKNMQEALIQTRMQSYAALQGRLCPPSPYPASVAYGAPGSNPSQPPFPPAQTPGQNAYATGQGQGWQPAPGGQYQAPPPPLQGQSSLGNQYTWK